MIEASGRRGIRGIQLKFVGFLLSGNSLKRPAAPLARQIDSVDRYDTDGRGSSTLVTGPVRLKTITWRPFVLFLPGF